MLLRIFRCNLPSSVLPAVASAAVPVLPRRCSCRCSFCCFGWSCIVPVALPAAFMSLPSPNFPCRPMRPVPPRTASGQPPFRARNPHWGLYERPLQNCVAAACGSKYINSCTATYNLCVKLFRGACGSKFPSSVFVSLPPGQALSRSLLI